MAAGAADHVDHRVVLLQQRLTLDLMKGGVKLTGQMADRLGEVFWHHVLGWGVDEIPYQTDGVQLAADPLRVAAVRQRQAHAGRVEFFIAVVAIAGQRPAEYRLFGGLRGVGLRAGRRGCVQVIVARR